VRLVSGKGDFVRRRNSQGKIEQVCLCLYNADFSVGGCISQVPCELISEVIAHEGEYAKGNLARYRNEKLDLDKRCDYCYGKGTGKGNWGKVTARDVDENTRRDFEEKQPGYVRLSKVTEGGHPFYMSTLLDFLYLCNEFETKVIFPTKMLPFGNEGLKKIKLSKELITEIPRGEELAKLLVANKGVLHYSIGYDKFESGVVQQGFTNEWRIEQAKRYFKERVNTTLTLVCDVTTSIEENIRKGSSIDKALFARDKFWIPLRIIPLRINSRKFGYEVTGKRFEELLGVNLSEEQLGLNLKISEPLRRYQRRPNSTLDPNFLHSDFQKLQNEGVGFCGKIGKLEYCDKCNLQGKTRIVFPISEIIPVKYDRNPKTSRRAIQRNKKSKDQLKFKF